MCDFRLLTLTADDLNGGMPLQPLCNARRATIFENVLDLSAIEINDDRAVAPLFPPTRVINANDPCRRFVVGLRSTPLQVPKDGVVAERHPQLSHQALCGRPPVPCPSRATIVVTLVVLRA